MAMSTCITEISYHNDYIYYIAYKIDIYNLISYKSKSGV